MPGPWHDAFTRLFHEHPELTVGILRQIGDLAVPPDAPVYPAGEALSTRQSDDLATDRTILVGPWRDPLLAIIVEVQAEPDEDKALQIPRYAAATWLLCKCPVVVLVICPGEATARFYAQPREVSLKGLLYPPAVLLPSQVPAVRDPAEVAADPVAGLLSVAYHGRDRALAEAFARGISSLPDEESDRYYEYAYALTPQDVRGILEATMTTMQPPRFSRVATENYAKGQVDGKAEGRAEGRAEGERNAVRTVLRARGLSLTEAQSAQIDACSDVDTLTSWLAAAATATNAGGIFD